MSDDPYPLEPFLRKDLPMTTIRRKEDLDRFGGKWIVLRSNFWIITGQKNGELRPVVGRLGSVEENKYTGGRARTFERLIDRKNAPGAFCLLSQKNIDTPVWVSGSSTEGDVVEVPHVVEVRLLTDDEIVVLRKYLTGALPGPPRGREFGMSRKTGHVTDGHEIFPSGLKNE